MHIFLVLFTLILSFFFSPLAYSASPDSKNRVYSMNSSHDNHFVMLSNWFGEKVFSQHKYTSNEIQEYLSNGDAIWIWCHNKNYRNRVSRISVDKQRPHTVITIRLSNTSPCYNTMSLLSNHPIPDQTWSYQQATIEQKNKIASELGEEDVTVIEYTSKDNKKYYRVLLNDVVTEFGGSEKGYIFMNEKLEEIGRPYNLILTPYIDLDDDGIPEFHYSSPDGEENWLINITSLKPR